MSRGRKPNLQTPFAQVRVALRASREQFAKSLGISPHTIQSIELGKLPVSESIASQLLHSFLVDPVSLRQPTGAPKDIFGRKFGAEAIRDLVLGTEDKTAAKVAIRKHEKRLEKAQRKRVEDSVSKINEALDHASQINILNEAIDKVCRALAAVETEIKNLPTKPVTLCMYVPYRLIPSVEKLAREQGVSVQEFLDSMVSEEKSK